MFGNWTMSSRLLLLFVTGSCLANNATTSTSFTMESFLLELRNGLYHYLYQLPREEHNYTFVGIFAVVIMVGLEILSYIAFHIGGWSHAKAIPVRGKHLDELSMLDLTFITLNKCTAVPFVYCYLWHMCRCEKVEWTSMTLVNTLVVFPLLFVVFDFFYTLLHWFLHVKGVYGWIHKHHHHQKAPSRGNVDAINVHPIEYILGEFNHLLALYVVTEVFQLSIHFVTAIFFVLIGGILAGINHTRYDVQILGGLYDSKAHDVHHRIPQSNYGQYTMLWDVLLGSYRSYNPNDRINPQAQLASNGKSLEYNASQEKRKTI